MNSIINAVKNYKVKVINITNDKSLVKSQKVNETPIEETTEEELSEEEESSEENRTRINEKVKKIYWL